MFHKLFLSGILSLTMVVSGAFAAPQRGNARGANAAANAANTATSAATQSAPVSARAAVRRTVNTTTAAPTTSGNVAARAGKKQTVKATTTTAAAKPVAARAGSTQKVLQTGSKVATAATNTVVPQECQDAFYGCMDAFCMLDNVSGGRCQCSDRITELDQALEDILKLDEQTYIMATEGVERIQMGEAEEQIIARAKAMADSVVETEKKTNKQTSKTTTPKLPTVSWGNVYSSSAFDEDETSLLGMEMEDAISDKTGDDLQHEALRLCAAQIPTQCTSYSKMLQMVYAQRIKSDCVAYENSLKQQKSASQEKLLTAQKALRDAALGEYQNQNKYKTEGECIAAFDTCMQTTAGCGSDYSKCVADDTVLTMNADGSRGKAAASKAIKTSASQIDVSANTLAMLTDKAPLCESVLNQCKNVRATVWNSYLKIIAPTLKSAEVIAESNRRLNCVDNIVDCFSKGCAAKWPNQESAEYDMCLSNPEILGNICQIQINQCGGATGDQVMGYVNAKLNAMRVDACTAQVKECLLSEDRCGADYAGCIGLDSATIARLCPAAKLTACMSKYSIEGDENNPSVSEYVAQIAQGLALQIDNKMAETCQKVADEAMIKVCGATDSCEKLTFDLTGLASQIKVEPCMLSGTDEYKKCLPMLEQFTDSEIYPFTYNVVYDNSETKSSIKSVNKTKRSGGVGDGVYARLRNMPNVSVIQLDGTTFSGVATDTGGYSAQSTTSLVEILNATLKNAMEQIESDPKVEYCRTGRKVQGFKEDETFGKDGDGAGRFSKLTDNYESIIANELLAKAYSKNTELESKYSEKQEEMNAKITERLSQIAKKMDADLEAAYANAEAATDASNLERCVDKIDSADYRGKNVKNNCGWPVASWSKSLTNVYASYDAEKNICTRKTVQFECKDWTSTNMFCHYYCAEFDEGTTIETKQEQMPKSK